ncbi:MAG: formylglycine-generating enzyme family protein [Calothrix sp. CSU_2_0]|nr:formylglycine-generating enzyme family protein [Calothrix sp. CSU_2_0]
MRQLFIETRGRPGRLLEAGDKLYRQIVSSGSKVVNLLPELNIFEFETAKVEVKQRRRLTGLIGDSYKTEIIRSRGNARYFVEHLGNDITLEMVEIPAGSFIMGAPASEEGSRDSERPQHEVNIPSFFMGKYPVTQAQWKFVAALPQVNHVLKSDPSHFKGDNRPVEQVSWIDAVEFCDRISQYTGKNYRLPSEAEWEYACRAGTITPFHFGETITSELANYNAEYIYGAGQKGMYRQETTKVGSFGVANAFGLYDMHGNVREWCLDDWHNDYEDAPTDGSPFLIENDNTYQVSTTLRGGSWNYFPDNCRCAYRNGYDRRDYIFSNVGFRMVCGLGSMSLL